MLFSMTGSVSRSVPESVPESVSRTPTACCVVKASKKRIRLILSSVELIGAQKRLSHDSREVQLVVGDGTIYDYFWHSKNSNPPQFHAQK